MKKTQTKMDFEKVVVTEMIALYCQKTHKKKGALCTECAALAEYACVHSDNCPFAQTKTFCSNCAVHCYRPDMRRRIRAVMRFSGPRMLLYHPVLSLRHLRLRRREKRKERRT